MGFGGTFLFGHSAIAAPSCSGISATAMAFGNYNPVNAANVDSAATISYSCPPPTVPLVTVTTGTGGSYSPRLMKQGATETIGYNLYRNALRTEIWGDGTGGTFSMTLPTGNNRTAPIYGRVFASQNVVAGAFTDTVTIIFNF